MSHPSNIPKICNRFTPLQTLKTRVALEIACQYKAREMCYKTPRISHTMDGILLSLYFYTKYPDRVGYTVNIFLFPCLYQTASSEATLVDKRWDTSLDSISLMTFSDTSALLQIQKISSIIGWEAMVNMLDQREVSLQVVLGTASGHLSVYELSMLIESVEEVNAHLR